MLGTGKLFFAGSLENIVGGVEADVGVVHNRIRLSRELPRSCVCASSVVLYCVPPWPGI